MPFHQARAVGLVLLLTASGCAGTPPAGAGTTTTSPNPSPPPPTVPTGPSAYADWVALQGFGGGSGIAALARAPRYLREHRDDPGFDLTAWGEISESLVRWLDTHEATGCWASYRTAALEQLEAVVDDVAALRALADAGTTLTTDLIDRLEEDVTELNALPTPVGCD